MTVAYGVLCDTEGFASKEVLEQGLHGPQLRTRAWSTPAAEVQDVQAERIPIDLDHDGHEVGEIIHLERRGRHLWAIGHVRDDIQPAVNVRVGDETVAVPTALYWSAWRRSTPDDTDIIIESVALTASPARVSPTPVTFLDGELDFRGCTRRWWQLDERTKAMLERGAETVYWRRGQHGQPLRVRDADRNLDHLANLSDTEKYIAITEQYDEAWQHRPLRYRPGRIIGIR